MRSHVSNPELAAMTRDPERAMRNRANPSFHTTSRQVKLKSEAVQEPKKSLDAAFGSDNERSPFKPTTKYPLARQSSHPSQTRSSPQNWKMQYEKRESRKQNASLPSRPTHRRITSAALKAAIDAQSDAFVGRVEEASTRLKHASLFFLEDILSKMEKKDCLDYPLEHIRDRWKRSSSFTDAFIQIALKSPRFVRPFAMFILKILKDEVELTAEKKKMNNSACKLSKSSSSSFRTAFEKRHCKHTRNHRVKT